MDLKDLAGAIAHVNSAWSIAAFAIAAILGVLNRTLASSDAQKRRGKRAPAILSNSFVWPIVGAICFLGAIPILANTYLESLKIRGGEFYRVRVIVLDPQGNPAEGATLRTTVSNETTATSQDTAVVTIPKALVPADGKVTVFADLESAFLHGRTDVQLGCGPQSLDHGQSEGGPRCDRRRSGPGRFRKGGRGRDRQRRRRGVWRDVGDRELSLENQRSRRSGCEIARREAGLRGGRSGSSCRPGTGDDRPTSGTTATTR